MTNFKTLLDPLGFPISPEALWESTVETVKTGIAETKGAIVETSNIVTGKGLDMKASITFDKDTAKKPELIKGEREQKEIKRQRIFFANLEEAQKNAQNYAHTPTLDEEMATQQFLSLGGDEKKKILHVSTSADDKHFNTAYHTAAGRIELLEKQKAQKQATEERIVAPKDQGDFQMREGELFMGNERSGGGHWTNNPG